jgi:hypothetical protein
MEKLTTAMEVPARGREFSDDFIYLLNILQSNHKCNEQARMIIFAYERGIK